MVLGTRRGAGPIAPLFDPDLHLAGLQHPGALPERPLEETVLDALHPDSDPQLIELVKALPPQDLKIVLMKTATGCAWATAATACGQPAHRGETVRRRLQRRRATLESADRPEPGTAQNLGAGPGWVAPVEHGLDRAGRAR